MLQNDYTMSDHKRKRSTCEGDTTKLAGVKQVPYFVGLPEGLAELADLVLLVEGHELPVHSLILTRKSPVLLTAVTTASKPSQRVCEVPLPGETKGTVVKILRYMYQETLQIDSISDAEILVKFAHKYNMTELPKLCDKYLVANLHQVLTLSTVFGWAQIAEDNHMSTLLAHCEQYIALNFRKMSVEQKQLSKLSHSSLRRIMECMAGKEAGWFDQPYLLQDSAKTFSKISLCKLCYCVIKSTRSCPCTVVTDGHDHTGYTSRLHSVQKITREALNALTDAAVPSIDLLIRRQQA